ncbi:unnamed protein product [Brassica rapa]|uniref:Uncharacterized protein n=2 Tax=Brassica TaxID=3705 RepID=A0A3P5ZH55_BRACM|nr:unnamed protein product [Brassica napus]CAG7880128.1 unnamed protein product [Brassica rapa]VDC79557.1 unnamed protein product [Brassica rapa]
MFKFADITISKTLVAQKSKHISIYHDSSNLTTFIHHTLNKIFQGPPRKPSIIFPLKSQPASSVISLAFQHMFTNDNRKRFESIIIKLQTKKLNLRIVGLYPEGSPSRNSRRPKTSLDPGGGLEIVFNQQ